MLSPLPPPGEAVVDYEYVDENQPPLEHFRCFVCQSPAVFPVCLPHTDPHANCTPVACRTCFDELRANTPPSPPTSATDSAVAHIPCPNCRRPCALPPDSIPNRYIMLALSAAGPVRCGHCRRITTTLDVTGHLRDCAVRILNELRAGHDWNRIDPTGFLSPCLRHPASPCARRCVWADRLTDLLRRRHDGESHRPEEVRGFAVAWLRGLLRGPGNRHHYGYLALPEFAATLRRCPDPGLSLWLDAGEYAAPRPVTPYEHVAVLKLLSHAPTPTAAVPADTLRRALRLLDVAGARAVEEGSDLRGLDDDALAAYDDSAVDSDLLPETALALRRTVRARGGRSCLPEAAALCVVWLRRGRLRGWTDAETQGLCALPTLPMDALTALVRWVYGSHDGGSSPPRASAAVAAACLREWRVRRERADLFPLPPPGTTITVDEAAATLRACAADRPYLMQRLAERAAAADVRLVDAFALAAAAIHAADQSVLADFGTAALQPLLGGEDGVKDARPPALPPVLAAALPAADLDRIHRDRIVDALAADVRLLTLHFRALPCGGRAEFTAATVELGYFVLLVRTLPSSSTQALAALVARYGPRLGRAAARQLEAAIEGPHLAAARAPWLERTLQARVVLLLVALALRTDTQDGGGPVGGLSDAAFEGALRWLTLCKPRALPRARWWYTVALGPGLWNTSDAAVVAEDGATLAFLVHRIGFGAPGAERRALENRLLRVRADRWTPTAACIVLTAAPEAFTEEWAWRCLFDPNMSPATVRAVLNHPGLRTGGGGTVSQPHWTTLLRLQHVLPDHRPPPRGAEAGAVLRLVHPGGLENAHALQGALEEMAHAENPVVDRAVACRWCLAALMPSPPDSGVLWPAAQGFVIERLARWAPLVAAGSSLPDAFCTRWRLTGLRPDATAAGWLASIAVCAELGSDAALESMCVAFLDTPQCELVHRRIHFFESFLVRLLARALAVDGSSRYLPNTAELGLMLYLESSVCLPVLESSVLWTLGNPVLTSAARNLHRHRLSPRTLSMLMDRAIATARFGVWALVILVNGTLRQVWVNDIMDRDNFGSFGTLLEAVVDPATGNLRDPLLAGAIDMVVELLADRLGDYDGDFSEESHPSDLLRAVRALFDIAAANPSILSLRGYANIHRAHLSDVTPEAMGRLIRYEEPEGLGSVAAILINWLNANTAQTVRALVDDEAVVRRFIGRLNDADEWQAAADLDALVDARRREYAIQHTT
jgi:hypothetical protein